MGAGLVAPPLTLVVEPDADTRDLYSQHLSIHGYRIEQASDGREALAKAISSQPDFIVTETRLTGFDGYRLCALLRSDRDTRSTPIIIVSSETVPGAVERAKAVGADSLLIKPCLPEVLLAEMRRLRERSRDLRTQFVMLRAKVDQENARAEAAIEHASRLNRLHQRYTSTTPPLTPPDLICPRCEGRLKYDRSYVGGVSRRHPEQWDYFECPGGCGRFQYRQRTRKIRTI